MFVAQGIVAAMAGSRAPFAGVQYQATHTTVTDETTTVVTGAAIGVPHQDRLVVLGIFQGVNADVTAALVNGYDFFHKTRLNEFAITAHAVPTGTTATISVSATGSVRKAIAVFVCYPISPIPLDSGSATANTGTDAVVSNIKVQAGGALVFMGGQLSVLGGFTTTWTGVDAVVESVNAQLESVSCYTAGLINVTRSSDLDDLTMAETASGTKRLVVASWGPPRLSV